MIITSVQNELIKTVYKLKKKSYRDEKKLFIIENIKLFSEVIKEFELHKVLVLKEKEEKLSTYLNGIDIEKIFLISDNVLKKVSNENTPQGIVGIFKQKGILNYNLEGESALALDDISDPQNIGAILRTCKAFDVPIILSTECADIYSHKVIKSSMGAFSYEKVIKTNNLMNYLVSLKEKGYMVTATLLDSDSTSFKKASKEKEIYVIGSEGQGIRDEITEIADKKVILPMKNSTQSLNAGICASIMAWEIGKG